MWVGKIIFDYVEMSTVNKQYECTLFKQYARNNLNRQFPVRSIYLDVFKGFCCFKPIQIK